MSSKEQKHTERSAKRPRVDQNLPSDDLQNPGRVTSANNPAADTSEMGGCSSGSNVQEAREPVQKRIRDFKGDPKTALQERYRQFFAGDITRSFLAKRKQYEKDIHASFRILNANLYGIFKAQQKSRQELHAMHSQMFESLHQEWLDDVESSRKQEDHLALITWKQMKILQKAIGDHETMIGNAKDLCDTFLKKAKDLHEHGKAFIGGEESAVKKEISKAQDRVIMESQEQDVSVVETYLQSLVLDSCEETF